MSRLLVWTSCVVQVSFATEDTLCYAAVDTSTAGGLEADHC
jgi:hypothetical protein